MAWPYPSVGTYKSITDVVTPRFAERKAKGEVIVNPLSITELERSLSLSTLAYQVDYHPSYPSKDKHCPKYFWSSVDNNPLALNAHIGPVGHIPAKISLDVLVRAAGTQARDNIDDPTFEGWVFVGELRETIGFLKKPITGVNSLLKKARRHKNRSSRNSDLTVFDFISRNYLGYRYGFRPLMYEVESALEAIHSTGISRAVRKTARGRASDSSNKTVSGAAPVDSRFDYVTNTATTYSARAGVLYELERDPDTFGVGFDQLPSAAWELIPFSFIVDWYFNVGSYIGAITPKVGVKVLGEWTTVVREATTSRETHFERGGTHGNGMPLQILANGMAREEVTSRFINRRTGISVGLSPNRVLLDEDLGVARIADLLAISKEILLSK
jgi:hypothetical protein